MWNVEPSVEDVRSPEDDEELAGRVVAFDPFEGCRLKPDEIQNVVPVGEMCHEASLATLSFLLVAQDLASHLHERHLGRQFMDIVQARPVDVLVGKVVEEITERRDAKFRLQQLGPLRTYAGKVGDGG